MPKSGPVYAMDLSNVFFLDNYGEADKQCLANEGWAVPFLKELCCHVMSKLFVFFFLLEHLVFGRWDKALGFNYSMMRFECCGHISFRLWLKLKFRDLVVLGESPPKGLTFEVKPSCLHQRRASFSLLRKWTVLENNQSQENAASQSFGVYTRGIERLMNKLKIKDI